MTASTRNTWYETVGWAPSAAFASTDSQITASSGCPGAVRSIRPGFGLPPKHFDAVVGRRVRSAVAAGTALSWELLE